MQRHIISDFIGIVDTIALATTWWSVARNNASYPDWRRKCALGGLMFGCFSGLMWLAIIVQISMNINDETGYEVPMLALIMVLFSLVGLILALIGKGSPRKLALFWSDGLFLLTFVFLWAMTTARPLG
jgi:hypothetical protein